MFACGIVPETAEKPRGPFFLPAPKLRRRKFPRPEKIKPDRGRRTTGEGTDLKRHAQRAREKFTPAQDHEQHAAREHSRRAPYTPLSGRGSATGEQGRQKRRAAHA